MGDLKQRYLNMEIKRTFPGWQKRCIGDPLLTIIIVVESDRTNELTNFEWALTVVSNSWNMALDSEVTRPTPLVKDGVLDARGVADFDQDGMMRLDGTWTFYPNVLASPDALPVEQAVGIQVPGNWRKTVPEQQLFGSGTYEAVILLAATAPPVIGIKVTNIRMSHRPYVNGHLLYYDQSEFLQRTSHELKTPLHGIRNAVQLHDPAPPASLKGVGGVCYKRPPEGCFFCISSPTPDTIFLKILQLSVL